jgi:hypothetical protein
MPEDSTTAKATSSRSALPNKRTALSALDQLAAYERLAQSQGYFGKPPEADNFQRAKRMLDIQARALQIDDEARGRTGAAPAYACKRLALFWFEARKRRDKPVWRSE